MPFVVPYIGTWIETLNLMKPTEASQVVPYIGTWIETPRLRLATLMDKVVPYIGTWIETKLRNMIKLRKGRTLYRYVD